ncbi:MAG TPA: DUF3866 family protein [Segeticoccus sp.]|nr:DUF3866 family protein [Segeticoccus sp.]
MVTWREGRVLAVRSRRPGLVEYAVRLPPVPGSPERTVTALGYAELVGEASPGDRVLLTTDALDLGLGTGGYAFVAAVPDRLSDASSPGSTSGSSPGSTSGSSPRSPSGPARVVKGRYTPWQVPVAAVEDHRSPHHGTLRDADDLSGLPVVAVELHSALPAVLAGIRERGAGLRVSYVMTDGAALPLALSDTVHGLRECGWLAGVVTTGQAFGGDLEAVTVHSGLLAARHALGADVVVVGPGPGGVGTGTRWGFTGVAAGEAVNAVGALGGRAVAALRVSGADPRPRHQGLSHHSRTAYGRVALAPADLPVPLLLGDAADAGAGDGCGTEVGALLRRQVAELVAHAGARLTAHDIEVDGLTEALRACPVPLSTMGRGLAQDPAAFLAAAAAGRHAATLPRT